MKKILGVILLSFFAQFIFSFSAYARENVDYWYIKDFHSEIVVNKDSSLLITEKITADCGFCVNKHGIFRILPVQTNTTIGTLKRPVELISITDFDDNPLTYNEKNSGGTVTFKIGDPDVTVQGLNYYKIVYKVQNAIYFGGKDLDELYWNLNGDFWDLETDNFSADIVFPAEVSKNNSTIDYFTGAFGSTSKDLAKYKWKDDHTLHFSSVRSLGLGEGITASVMFPKNIFIPYKFTFMELYGNYLWLILPLIVLIFCFVMWKKYGDDPENDKSIMPEFASPEDLTPMQLGVLMNSGDFENTFVTATLINLAVKGIISIKEIDSKFLFFTSKDYELSPSNKDINSVKGLSEADIFVYGNLFNSMTIVNVFKGIIGDAMSGKKVETSVSGSSIKLTDLKDSFYKVLDPLKKQVVDELYDKGLIEKYGLALKTAFFGVGGFLCFFVFLLVGWEIIDDNGFALLSLVLSAVILFLFAFIMPKKTVKGVELSRRIKGFKMYMETAEKYRQQFNEKENIFERFLPYAIVFGITSLWAKKMAIIYGEKYFATHHPIWFSSHSQHFDAGDFSSHMTSLASSISSAVSAPSGSSGGGSGGGGGGGGGGGW